MKKLFLFFIFLNSINAYAVKWLVGPAQAYTYCSQVAALVQNGDTVQIEFATYIDDAQVTWTQNNILIEGIGGRPRLQAGPIIANDQVNGKGIFVIKGQGVHVRNIEFANAKVVDMNGAGIRQEGANLKLTSCKFMDNENGILAGAIANCKTTIEYCEFVNNGAPANPGYQHNIYIGQIDTLLFRYNYTHNASSQGHELKSRAKNNFILYNRIANENTIDSRTIDLPNGGTAVLVGNIIEQGINSANHNIMGYGLEGLSNPAPHNVWMCNNTFINKHTNGSFVSVAAGTDTLFVKNNAFAGPKPAGLFIGSATVLDSANNIINDAISAFQFVDAVNYNYKLNPGSVLINNGMAINKVVRGYSLTPSFTYKDTCNFEARALNGTIDVGAYEYSFPQAVTLINKPEILVYPNPFSDKLYVKNAEGSKYILYDAVMRVVTQGDVSKSEICLNHLQKGIYYLHISNQIFILNHQ